MGEVLIEDIEGVAFINEMGQIDAVLNINDESILLSEMQDAGLINNCGWFKKLAKKVVKVAVVATTAAVVVATAGAAAPALVAAGVGITTSTGLGVAAGVSAGALFSATIGLAALEAGTAVSEPISEGVSQIVDKATRAILEIVHGTVRYAAALLTASVINTLNKNHYFIALANTDDGKMYYSTIAIDRSLAVSIIRENTSLSIYTYYDANARSVAQEAGDNCSPIYETAHQIGYFNHYHLGNQGSHKEAKSHAFFGLPRIV